MNIADALRECLNREWGDTEETRFILAAFNAHNKLVEAAQRAVGDITTGTCDDSTVAELRDALKGLI